MTIIVYMLYIYTYISTHRKLRDVIRIYPADSMGLNGRNLFPFFDEKWDMEIQWDMCELKFGDI